MKALSLPSPKVMLSLGYKRGFPSSSMYLRRALTPTYAHLHIVRDVDDYGLNGWITSCAQTRNQRGVLMHPLD